jgi:hypothetical protein
MPTLFVRVREWYARQPTALKVLVIAGGGLTAVGVGVAAAPAVGAALSAAGIGAAGGTLSGAAASSAGLAALGGGSIAAGGAGMAGGTAVVAGVTGMGGTVGAVLVSREVARQGARLADLGRRAREVVVDASGIRFE